MATRATTATRTRSTAKGRSAPARKTRRADGAARESAPPRRRARAAKPELLEIQLEVPAPAEKPGRVAGVARKLKSASAGVGTGVKSAGSVVGGAIAENPVPAALIGAGVAWLLVGSRARGVQRRVARAVEESDLLERAEETINDVSERLTGAAETVKDAFLAGLGSVGESVAGAAESVKDGTGRLGEYAQDGARAVGSKVLGGAKAVGSTVREGAAVVGSGARRGLSASKEGAAQVWQQHPLSVGLAMLAAGVAAGLLLPRTQRENDMMGRRSDEMSRRLKSAGGSVVNRGRKVAAAVADALKEEAEGEGLGASEVVRKVRRIAEHVQEATLTAARRERLDPVSVLKEPDPAASPRNGTANGRS